MNAAPLDTCPSCGHAGYTKLLSAAGFQLKGSGWYATDFKGGSSSPAKGSEAPASTTSESTAPAASCGGGCACH